MGHMAADMMDKKNYGSGMVWGLIVGFAAGILLAPGNGRENRARIQHKVSQLKSKAKQSQDIVADKLEGAADTLQDLTDKTEDIASRSRKNNPLD